MIGKKPVLHCVLLLLAMGLYAQNTASFQESQDEEFAYTEITASYALVIGESSYMHFNSLPGVAEDVDAVKTLLEEQGFIVEVEMDLGQAVLPRVKDFFSKYGYYEDAQLLFYFAGHGLSLNGEGYILPIDTPNPRINEIEFRRRAIRMEHFVTMTKDYTSRHILMMFDSCFSGEIFQYRGERPSESIVHSIREPVRHFITSGSDNEKVPDESIFRHQFEVALRDKEADLNKDGYITGTELGEYLKEEVINGSGGRQTPQSAKMNDRRYNQGDFIFIARMDTQAEEERTTGLDSYNRGLAYLNQGEHEKAIAEFTRSIRNNAMYSALAYKDRGNAHYYNGDYAKAIADYGQTLIINPNDTSVYINRGAAYLQLGDMIKALEDFSKAISLSPDLPDAYNYRGNVYLSMGAHDMAITDFNKALEINPEYISALNNRGNAYRAKGNLTQAVADFTYARQLSFGNAVAYQSRGIVNLEIDDADRAISEYTRIISSDTQGVAYYSRGLAYRAKGELAKALDDYSSALALNPRYLEALHARAQVYAAMGELDKAIADYSNVIAADPSFWEAYFSRGDAYIAVANWGKAADDFYYGFNYLANEENQTYIYYAWDLLKLFYKHFPYFTFDDLQSTSMQFALIVLDSVSESIRRIELSGRSGNSLMEMCFYYAGVDLETSFGSVEKAFLYSESLRNIGNLKQLGTETALRLSGISVEERTASKELSSKLHSLQILLDDLGTRNLDDRGKVEYREILAQYNDAEQKLLALHEILGNRIPQFRELSNPRQMTIEEARTFCGDDRVFLEYTLWEPANTPEGFGINSYCFVLSSEGVKAVRLDHQFDYQDAVNDVMQIIDHPISVSIVEHNINNLYNYLLKNILPLIPANVKIISIVPDGTLGGLCFDILRENNQSADFGETYRLSFSLSVAVSALAAGRIQTANEPILAFGGVRFDQMSDDMGITRDVFFEEGDEWYGPIDRERIFWRFMPGSLREINNIVATGLETTLVTGTEASEARLKEMSRTGELKKYRVLHFALHGALNNSDYDSSSLVFSEANGSFPESTDDGYLTLPEITLLDIDANIVILSVNNTGGINDSTSNFIYSFKSAGVAQVISALGMLDDNAAVTFMASLYNKVYTAGLNFRDALYEVKNDFRQGNPLNRRPYYWAGFTLYD